MVWHRIGYFDFIQLRLRLKFFNSFIREFIVQFIAESLCTTFWREVCEKFTKKEKIFPVVLILN